ncbi:outer membrane protein assembly factor BamB family protein [Roseiconus lacunae]|uniref:PQQ-binding-like beta-propeller repeat protein n=1 Tax=Roseiconus lacunae TaxID=2605694 RepID=A0ABT7PFU3_9BACT|nr:PQQ-binding-like beta-propeller repeat protein [Roseiconus lacunae]MCD0461461.1 PQQ-binding-like beta-propeller repeat protein [Roseiconus lacunae]MDM4015360.1 PQQ-binding-like beta-propeller repeat protein [Roseiconus lacunae]WRQ52962.1 PQQ-binding-like beta-propeller repeat protein [Stieleria sp. HD01]
MRSTLSAAFCVFVALSCTALGFTSLGSSTASATDWRHWRGPTGNGVASKGTPPTSWSLDKNVKWKVAIPGRGSGSPIVVDDRVFVVTAVPTGRGGGSLPELSFQLHCFDRNSGQARWNKVAVVATPHQETHSTNGFASASPCSDGEHVYAHFGSRGLYCYTLKGELVWKREDFGRMETRSSFGEGSSPTLAGEKIIVPWDHEGASALYALDKRTGKTIWRTARDEPSCWATPLIIEHDGSRQVIMNGQNAARSYDLETGAELWRCGGQTVRPVASPVADDRYVYIGSGFRGAFMAAFKPGGRGDIEGTDKVVWTVDRDTPDIASPLLSDGRLYFHKGKSGILSCLDANTGKPHYAAERINSIRSTYASPVAAGGHVYLTGRGGTIVVIADSERFEIVSENTLGEGIDATPAPAGDELFIRGEQHLFCISKS